MQSFFDDVASDLHAYYDQMVAIFPKLAISLVVILLFWPLFSMILRRLRPFLLDKLEDKLLARFVVRVIKVAFILIIVLLVLQILGLQGIAAALWGTAGIGAFIIGFALKDIFEHFLAGFLLAFNRPFRIGDTVELDGVKGIVMALNMRNTHIKSFDGQDIYIPNGNIIKNALHNYTIDGFLRFNYSLPISFGADVEGAVRIILDELAQIPGILTEGKRPFVTLEQVGNRSLDLGVYYWVDLFDEGVDIGSLKLDAVNNVVHALEKAGYQIPGDSLVVTRKDQKVI